MKQKALAKERLKEIIEPGAERLREANPYLDIFSPLFGALWAIISFIPAIVVHITTGEFPAKELINAFICIESLALAARQGVSLTSLLSDTVNWFTRFFQNDRFANALRGTQIGLLLITFGMYLYNFALLVLTHAAPLVVPLSTFLSSNIVTVLTTICSIVPIISVIAAAFGTSFYLYQAVRAHQGVKHYQKEIDELNKKYPVEYQDLYKNLLKPGADINTLCMGLPQEASDYLYDRHLFEKRKYEREKTRTGQIYWTVFTAFNLGLAIINSIIVFTPLNTLFPAIAALKAINTAVLLGNVFSNSIFYYFTRFNNARDKQMPQEQQNITAAVQLLEKRPPSKKDIHSDLNNKHTQSVNDNNNPTSPGRSQFSLLKKDKNITETQNVSVPAGEDELASKNGASPRLM